MKHASTFYLITCAIIAAGCRSIVTSEKNPKLAQIEIPQAGTYARWEGLPYFLPKARIRVDGTWNKDSKEWDVKATPIIEPDSSVSFRLDRKANALFEDDVTVAVDNNGLLQTINATSEDKTVSSIGDLIAAAANVLTFGAGLSPAGGLKINVTTDYPTNVLPSSSFHIVLDAIDSQSKTSQWVSAPPGNGVSIATQSNQYAYVTAAIIASPLPSSATNSPGTADLIDGIVVRAPSAFTVSIIPHVYLGNDLASELENGRPAKLKGKLIEGDTQIQVLILPDERTNYVLSIKRRYLVKDSTKVALVNGTVQSYGVTRPSIVAGIVGIPKTIVGALVPIPLQIRNSQLNNIKAISDIRKIEAELKSTEQ